MRVLNKDFTLHQLADLGILLLLMGLVSWYLLDAYHASAHIMNLILIVPVTVLFLMLCLVAFIRQIREKKPPAIQHEAVMTVASVIGLFSAYVLTLGWLGFDVGTFLFLSLFLYLNGERRLVWVFGYALVFASVTAIFFSKMITYPMPMLIMPSVY